MNNLVCGRATQNNRKQTDMQFVPDERIRNRHASSGDFKASKYISDLFLIFEIKRKNNKGKMNIPILVCESVLDLCIILIFEFYYGYKIPKWDKNNVKRIYMVQKLSYH